MDKTFSERDIAFLKKNVLRAGHRAAVMQKKGVTAARKSDSSIVTQADIMVQDYLVSKLSKRFGDVNLICEEGFSPPKNRLAEDTVTVIIDPIDGTAMYSMYMPFWCVSLGIFLGGMPLFGFVYAPAMDMLFHNDATHAYVNNRPVKVVTDFTIDSETNIFYATEIYKKLMIKFPGKARTLGSTALHACLTIDNGRNRTLAFIGKSYIWDWGGAIPVILKAGGGLKYLNGNNFDFREIADNGYVLPDYLIAYTYRDFAEVQRIFSPIR